MEGVKVLTADTTNEEGRVVENGVEMMIDMDIVNECKTLSNLIKDLGIETEKSENQEPIPLPNVTEPALESIISFYRHRIDHPEDIEWEREYFRVPDRDEVGLEAVVRRHRELIQIMLSANYLEAETLLNECAKSISRLMKNKSAEEIREEWELPDDLTEEEKETIRRENAWCMDL